MRPNSLMLFLILAVSGFAFAAPNAVSVSVDAADVCGDISPLLTGHNLIFCWQTADLMTDDVAAILRESRAGVLRYPGGEVTDYHHWETPGYPGWKDAWAQDPSHRHYVSPQEAAANTHHMDTDRYMAFCRKVGAEPMLGVNIESGATFDRTDDGIAEAVRWMRYCQQKGYEVKYWFLGNESYHTGTHYKMKAAEYGGYVRRYAEAMRAVDPDIKIIANWSSTFTAGPWGAMLEAADGHVDIADVHHYWNFGTASWDVWLGQAPMNVTNQWRKGGSYISEITKFRKMIKELGYDLDLAVLEWNVGPTVSGGGEIPEYQCAMIQSEQLGQYIAGGLDMATFWPMFTPHPKPTGKVGRYATRDYLDKNDCSPRTVHEAFKLWSHALGGRLVECATSEVRVPSVSALSKDGKTLRVWLQTKPLKPENREVILTINGFEAKKAEAIALTSTNTETDTGSVGPTEIEKKGKGYNLTLPPYSLTMVTLTQ